MKAAWCDYNYDILCGAFFFQEKKINKRPMINVRRQTYNHSRQTSIISVFSFPQSRCFAKDPEKTCREQSVRQHFNLKAGVMGGGFEHNSEDFTVSIIKKNNCTW